MDQPEAPTHLPAPPTAPPPDLRPPPPLSRALLRHAAGRALPWMLVAALLAAVAGVWWWAGHRDGAAVPGRPGAAGGRRFGGGGLVQPVSVQPVRRQDMRVVVRAIGSIAAANTAVVRAQVSGVLQRLDFQEGRPVRRGQLLAQIDPRAFDAALRQAGGALARDQAQLDNARADLGRYRGLLAQDAVAQQQVDTQAALVHQLEGTVAADQGTVASARLQLSYTRVTAPIDGRAGFKQADIGNLVQPGDANGIVSITQVRPIALVFAVPAAQLPLLHAHLRAGATVPVEAWDRSGGTLLASGRVATLDNAIDPATDTIKVKALFANADGALVPNQAVDVALQQDLLHGVLAVPQAAVLRGAQGFYVYVVRADKTVATRTVTTGASDGGWTAVQGDLQPGQEVVVDGTDRLRDGARVEVIAADPKQRAGAAPPAAGARRGGWADSASAAGHAAWMDRLPPALAARLAAMSPEERSAWIRERRAQRAGQGASSP